MERRKEQSDECGYRNVLSIVRDSAERRVKRAGMLAWGALEASGNPGDGFGFHGVLADRSRGLGLEILAEEIRLPSRHYFLRTREMGKMGKLGLRFRPLGLCGK